MKQQVEETCNQLMDLGEDLIAEILVRLPAKSVLRVRAVCKEWRRITTGKAFLARHARHGLLHVLVYTYDKHLVKLDAVPVSGVTQPARRRFAHFPRKNYFGDYYCLLLASCDGLLLLKNQCTGHHHICNPATRQWADLPQIPGVSPSMQRECGFYFHEPSGQYRLLSHVHDPTKPAAYYVFSAGFDEPRRLNVQATPIHMCYSNLPYLTTTILHGHLHWLSHPEAGFTNQVVAFDTVAETFRRISPPRVYCRSTTNLLAADGRLMVSDFGHFLVDLWVLEDYGAVGERWERRHRVELPCKIHMTGPSVVAGNHEGDVILGTEKGVAVYNVRSKKVRIIDIETSEELRLSRCVIRESLVPQRFFEARQYSGLPFISLF